MENTTYAVMSFLRNKCDQDGWFKDTENEKKF